MFFLDLYTDIFFRVYLNDTLHSLQSKDDYQRGVLNIIFLSNIICNFKQGSMLFDHLTPLEKRPINKFQNSLNSLKLDLIRLLKNPRMFNEKKSELLEKVENAVQFAKLAPKNNFKSFWKIFNLIFIKWHNNTKIYNELNIRENFQESLNYFLSLYYKLEDVSLEEFINEATERFNCDYSNLLADVSYFKKRERKLIYRFRKYLKLR